jgi:glycosyltransferase involved in cell wall biosynthesis
LLAPSTLEGFGLPVAEALLAGCHVVCSDIPVFRELGGNHCHYVPLGPNEVGAFTEAVRATLHQASPMPIALPQLSAPVIAEEYTQLYRSLSPAPQAIARTDQNSFAPQEKDVISYEPRIRLQDR